MRRLTTSFYSPVGATYHSGAKLKGCTINAPFCVCSHPDKKPVVDMRLYSDLLDTVPQGYVTVPLILHAMVEQV